MSGLTVLKHQQNHPAEIFFGLNRILIVQAGCFCTKPLNQKQFQRGYPMNKECTEKERQRQSKMLMGFANTPEKRKKMKLAQQKGQELRRELEAMEKKI
jgi:hypothetical protein